MPQILEWPCYNLSGLFDDIKAQTTLSNPKVFSMGYVLGKLLLQQGFLLTLGSHLIISHQFSVRIYC